MATATFRIWRGDRIGRKFVGLSRPKSRSGMVVLDAVHRIQADAGQRYGGALELQGREVRIVLGGNQRQAAADVHDAAERDRSRRAGHRRADAHLPARSRIW